MSTTRIALLRHGLPDGEHCFRGHADFVLTEVGFEQMSKATQDLTDIEVVVTSPLKRCADFGRWFAKESEISVEVNNNWMEIDFGDWDGKDKQQVWDQNEQALSLFWADPWNHSPPNGETLEHYDQRISLAWTQLLQRYKGKSILVVTHGGVIKQLMRQILQMPKSEHYLHRLNIPYAALINISVYHDDNGKVWPELHWPC